jgi:hypothetical protein
MNSLPADRSARLTDLAHRFSMLARLAVACGLVLTLAGGASAQPANPPSPAPSPGSEGEGPRAQGAAPAAPSDAEARIKDLEDDKKLLDKELERLKAEKALLQESLPKGTTAALGGGISITGNLDVPAQLVAYDALMHIASEISRQQLTRDKDAKRILIGQHDISNLVIALQIAQKQLGVINKQYQALLADPSARELAGAAVLPLLPSVATGVLSATADVLAFFRTDVTLSAVNLTVPHSALVAALARAFSDRDATVKVYNADLFTPDLLNAGDSSFLRLIDEVSQNAAKARQHVDEYEAQDDGAKKTNPFRPRIREMKALNELTNTTLAALTKSANGTTPLHELVKTEQIVAFLGDDTARFTFAAVVNGGGANKLTKSLWSGTRLSHTGGLAVTFQSYDRTGVIRAAATVGEMIGFRELRTDTDGTLVKIGFDPEQGRPSGERPAGTR